MKAAAIFLKRRKKINDAFKTYPKGKTIHEMIHMQAQKTPQAIAISFKERNITYLELNEKSNQLAIRLKKMGLKSGDLIAICLERSPELIIYILAILKAGGAYVPLDPKYPIKRIMYIIDDAKITYLVTEKKLISNFSTISPTCKIILTEYMSSLPNNSENLKNYISENNLAYVIYTSGSTGNPKGVKVTHKNVVNCLFGIQKHLKLKSCDKWLAITTISFDIAGLEIYLPLAIGASIILSSDDLSIDLYALSKLLISSQATIMQATPTLWSAFLQIDDWKISRHLKILCGGEALPIVLAKKLKQVSKEVWNLYGPTETTIWSSIYKITSVENITIGKPISNTTIDIVDENNQRSLTGIVGEIVIGGKGVALGYLNKPQLTAERFIINPFLHNSSALVYKTGDLGCKLPNGQIKYIGRMDTQVKIRGFRIELGEIENCLLSFESIQNAAVIVQNNSDSMDKKLIAYITIKEGMSDKTDEIRKFLKTQLPEYMLPSSIITIAKFPLTPNGKIDRKSLATAESQFSELIDNNLPTQDKLIQTMLSVWKTVLQRTDINMDDNFFDLGGNSILLIKVQIMLKKLLDNDISIVKLYQYPTIHSLAEALKLNQDYIVHSKNKADANEDIAIIGMSGKFPGASNIEQFWENIKLGRESITYFSDNELILNKVKKEYLSKENYVKANGILKDIDLFDAKFFGISPREAMLIDPQHRLFLECAWHALEQAGYIENHSSYSIAVYAGTGIFQNYFINYLLKTLDPADPAGQYAAILANSKDTLATRVSYKLNLTGPSVNVQTTCSTSLVAICQACESLLQRNCDIALAGGVSIKIPEIDGYFYQENMIFSPDGHCRPFDASANGTVSGNGLGVVVLKRLSDALADKDYIHAVIKGYGLNNDGSAKPGFTAPSVEGQAKAITDALAKINPEKISYIEAHGTGTQIGDPIEIEGLKKAFAVYSNKKNFCAIGSVKANIGHLDAAAGVAGVIKTIEILKNKQIPPNINFQLPNPKINFEETPFYVNKQLQSVQDKIEPIYAGISSFGMGGTNAHLILQEAPVLESSNHARAQQLLILSAKTKTALNTMVDNLGKYMIDYPKISLADIAYTLQVSRKKFKHHQIIIGKDRNCIVEQCFLKDKLKYYISSENLSNTFVSFLFPGQGSQYIKMGAELYQHDPDYREFIDQCSNYLMPYLKIDIRSILYPSSKDEKYNQELISQTWITQPVLFATEYALARLLMKWGIIPSAMLGHSLGEYVAACIAGVFSLEDALKIVTIRGKLIQKTPSGTMLAIALSADKLKLLLIPEIEIAAINSDEQCVVSGPIDKMEQFKQIIISKKITYKQLQTSRAFHSAMLDPIMDEFKKDFSKIVLNKPKLPYISNLTGDWIKEEEATSVDYWLQHMRMPVQFSQCLDTLEKINNSILLEVGPGKILTSFAKIKFKSTSHKMYLSCMKHVADAQSDAEIILQVLGTLCAVGIPIEWKNYYENEKRHLVPLPAYPFERERFWFDSVFDNINQHSILQLDNKPTYQDESIESTIKIMWENFFNVKPISLQDNFFSLGGDSLAGIQILSKMRAYFGVDIPINTIFIHPTIAELTKFIQQSLLKTNTQPKSINHDEILSETSVGQASLWFLDKMEQGNRAYNIPYILHIKGNLVISALESTLNKIIARHEALRTTFIESKGKLQQKILANLKIKIRSKNITHLTNIEKHKKLNYLKNKFIYNHFDLSTDALIRAHIIHWDIDDYYLVISLHHIISDGWSLNIMSKEISAFYQAEISKKQPMLNALPIQYSDFILEQKRYLSNNDSLYIKQLSFWKEQLAEAPLLLELPLDKMRPAKRICTGKSQSFILSKELRLKLKSFSEKYQSTPFMLLLSVFSILIARYCNQDDFLIGIPVANRNKKELEDLIGYFVNTLALRIKVNEKNTFIDFLNRIKSTTVSAYEHQDLPFEKLVESLHISRSLSYSPLFQVMMVYLNMNQSEFSIGNANASVENQDISYAKYDLTLMCIEKNDELTLRIDYADSLFEVETIQRIGSHLINLLNNAINNVDKNIYKISLLSVAEQEQLAYGWNHTDKIYSNLKLHELIEESIKQYPEKLAVIFNDKQLTYGELNRQADILASLLMKLAEKSVNPYVSLCLNPSTNIAVSILAILKAGGTYVPLDPRFPAERLNFILQDTQSTILITNTQFINTFKNFSGIIINIDNFKFDNSTKDNNLNLLKNPDDLAYIIYTSGSTGRPKGVLIGHKQITNYVHSISDILQPKSGDTYALVSTIAADLGNTVLFCSLCNGGCLHILSDSIILNAKLFEDYFSMHSIDFLKITPGHYSALFDATKSPTIIPKKYLILGGEATSWSLVEKIKKINPRANILNHYGPTETTVGILTYKYKNKSNSYFSKTLPIGSPLANTQCVILDKYLNPVPIGVKGELYISGVGVAKGYLNQVEISNDRFIKNLFNDQYIKYNYNPIFYKSGDIVRYLPDGNIEYVERIDHQIKIRGFRIELGEIEHALKKNPSIKEVIVLTHKDKSNSMCVVAYWSSDDALITDKILFDFIKENLPEYMLPAALIKVDRIPRNLNGKIDKDKLPKFELGNSVIYQQPRDALELKLLQIWSTILHIKIIGIYHNFFELGGHSLLAIELAHHISQTFNINFTVSTIFSYPTIEAHATIIRQKIANPTDLPLVPIQSKGDRPPLFVLHPIGGNVLCYYELSQQLGETQPVYGIQQNTHLKNLSKRTIADMARDYINAIREINPLGPYYLLGWSLGGIIAHEMAYQLEQESQDIAFLGMIDSSLENSNENLSEKEILMQLILDFNNRYGSTIDISAIDFEVLNGKERVDCLLNMMKQKRIIHSNATFEDLSNIIDKHLFNKRSVQLHQVKVVKAPIVFFSPIAETNSFNNESHWKKYTNNGVHFHKVDGNHYSVLSTSNVGKLVKILQTYLYGDFI